MLLVNGTGGHLERFCPDYPFDTHLPFPYIHLSYLESLIHSKTLPNGFTQTFRTKVSVAGLPQRT